MRLLTLLLLLPLLTTCQTAQAPEQTVVPGTPAALEAQRNACTQSGGNFSRPRENAPLLCIKPTRDANRACDSSSQCQGYCLARSKTCAPVTPLYGCFAVLTDGGGETEVCLQ